MHAYCAWNHALLRSNNPVLRSYDHGVFQNIGLPSENWLLTAEVTESMYENFI